MYIKRLIIESNDGIIRDIKFKMGINLIVDSNKKNIDSNNETGNSIGKTTILMLIDYCLGDKRDKIIKDSETKSSLVNIKEFLENKEVFVTLILSPNEDISIKDEDIIIKRNFQQKGKKFISINNNKLNKTDERSFCLNLDYVIFNRNDNNKPSYRELIAHNIRYSDERINNTLKFLSKYTSKAQYETLFLYMFGFPLDDRSYLMQKLKREENYKKRLLQGKNENEINLELEMIDDKIITLNNKKEKTIINENYENDIKTLNFYKKNISKIHDKILELELKKNLLLETKKELESNYSKVNISQIKKMYEQATSFNINNLQKKFEDIVYYHNNMIIEKIRFVTDDLPEIEKKLNEFKMNLKDVINQKNQLLLKIKNSNTLKDFENIVSELNKLYLRKGEINNFKTQINEVELKINEIDKEIKCIESDRFSEEFQKALNKRLARFNHYFSAISKEIYDESYNIKYKIDKDKKTSKNIYVFESFNNNIGSGKKQGEILCFDLAYILFAREFDIPHVNFLLNDKKELMDSIQLVKVSKFALENNIQLVFPILHDKLPKELDNNENIVIELSQKNKLFKIEN